MRKDPALSYRGALQLLGKHDRPVLDALDKLLGGVILASPLSPIALGSSDTTEVRDALSQLRVRFAAQHGNPLPTPQDLATMFRWRNRRGTSGPSKPPHDPGSAGPPSPPSSPDTASR